MAATVRITPLQLISLADWKRQYAFDFSRFVEFSVAPAPTISAVSVTETDTLAAVTISSVNPVNGTDPNGKPIRQVTAYLSGGLVGGGLPSPFSADGPPGYYLLAEATLTSGDVLSIPAFYSVVGPDYAGIARVTWQKLTDWDRHYVWPFALFAEFSRVPAPSITGGPVLTADPGPTYGAATVSGTNVSSFISGGLADVDYNLSMRVNLTDGSVLSIPGVLSVKSTQAT